ncbi:MAG: ribosome-associated translation inhibitor RaiA [Candidatus Zambryskibacteria bacterium]|nr:ribosome-associated translation inhibitor RaiA [Candidatus Zambryskibacteria bacterium]
MIKINTKATEISLTPAILDYIEKKLEVLEKFYDEMEDVIVDVEVGKTTQHHKSGDIFRAEIKLRARGKEYYTSAETEDLYASIDKVKDDIVRKLTSKRKKTLDLIRRGGAKIKNLIKFGRR